MHRPTETRLRRAFADVMTAILATAATAVIGCGGVATTTPGGETTSGGTSGGGGGGGGGGGVTPDFTSLCGQGVTKTFLQGLHTTPALDGVESRTETAFINDNTTGGTGGGVVTNPDVGDEWKGEDNEVVGALCSKATDQAACLAKAHGYRVLPTTYAACKTQYPATYGEQAGCHASYILYTRGDDVGVARTPDEIKALIGTFDTLEEALWAANSQSYTLTCGTGTGAPPESQYRTTQDGGFDLRLLQGGCNISPGGAPQDTYSVVVHVDYAGNVTVISKEKQDPQPCAVAGRRPEGLDLARAVAARGDAVGEHFAAMATLEAASVTAFRRLHRHLAGHGAPRELLARVRKAARDEIRHARATGALARKYGVAPAAPQIAQCDASPSLFTIALENAREGCVRETYGALVAQLQTTRAADAEVRACMAAIADEETEHAALSWDIATWIEAQLSDAERATLAAERRDAFVSLARDLAVPVDPRVAQISGVPHAADAVRMLAALEPTLLAA